MRSVIVHLRETIEEEVAGFLQRLYPLQNGPLWIADKAGDPVLFIDFYRDLDREMEVEDYFSLLASLGCDPAVSVAADVSGRHGGDEEVHSFVCALLSAFSGVAQDGYSEHFWSYEEIQQNATVQGLRFFDYLGYHRNRMLAAQAEALESEYRNNRELTAFETFGPDDLYECDTEADHETPTR